MKVQLFNGLTIERQEEIFLHVPVEIDPLSRDNECYANCVAKTQRDGGLVVVGWRRTCATEVAKLIATLDHHAIWQSPSEALIDISPRIRFLNGQYERIIDTHVDFMIDPAATFDDPKRARPSRVIPMTADTYGYLRKACEWAEAALDERESGDESKKAAYADKKVTEFLNRHYDKERKRGG
jgi:hypothetical protein